MKIVSGKKSIHSTGAYITKRVIVSSSRAAVRSAAARAIQVVGYVIKAKDGWIVRENKNGTIQKLERYRYSNHRRFALD